MTQIILHVVSLILVFTVCCLSMNEAVTAPVGLDLYRGRLIDADLEEMPFNEATPSSRPRSPRKGCEAPRKKRQEMNEMDNYYLIQFCRASRIDWPQCKLFNFPSQQSTTDETTPDGKVESAIQYRPSNGEVNSLRIREPKIRKDLMADEFNVRSTRPAIRQKRETSVTEAISSAQLPQDPEDQPGVNILLSDEQYEKRMTRFNSWGGKRADGNSADPSLEKRSVPFSSWGGKRGPLFSSWDGKMGSEFSSWDGKRGPAFSSWGGKRGPAFSSWGGKRSPAFSSWGGKRGAAFSSWGGKRDNALFDEEGKREATFPSWGGRTNSPFTAWDETEVTVNDSSDKAVDGRDGVYSGHMITETDSGSTPTISSAIDINMEEREGGYGELGSLEKRTKFSSWGGKRTSEIVEPLGDPEEVPEIPIMQKRSVHFSPWGGKRQAAISQSQTLYYNRGGKRGRTRNKQSSSPPLRQNRRGADFYPWGGKRSRDMIL